MRLIAINKFTFTINLSQINRKLKFNACLGKLFLCIPNDEHKLPIEPIPTSDLKKLRKTYSANLID
jgi:hypothetical protein